MKKNKKSGVSLLFVMILIGIISFALAVTVKRANLFMVESGIDIQRKQLSIKSLYLLETVQALLRERIQHAYRCHNETPLPTQLCAGWGFPTAGINPNDPLSWNGTWVAENIVNPSDPYRGVIQDRINTDASFVTIECAPNADPRFCQWNRQKFPKVFKVKSTTKDISKGIVVQYTATIEVSPESIRNIAYLVTQETHPDLTFGNGVYTGRVGVIFNNPNGRIRFAHTQSLTFQDVFFTNVVPNNMDFVFSPAVAAPQFQRGVATGVSNFANNLHATFSALKDGPGVIRPYDPANPNPLVRPVDTVFENVKLTLGSSTGGGGGTDLCSIKAEYQPYKIDVDACVQHYNALFPSPPLPFPIGPTLCAGSFYSWRFITPDGPPRVFHDGPVPPQAVFHAPVVTIQAMQNHYNISGAVDAESGVLVDTINPTDGHGSICRSPGQPLASNYTVVADADIHLRSSIIKGHTIGATEGNIALVSLNSPRGILVERSTRTLPIGPSAQSATFDEVLTQSISISPSEVSFQVDASLVALAPSSSAPKFGNELVDQDGKHLGTFRTNGGLIGAQYDYSRYLDSSSGAVRSGFDNVEFNFNEGALASSPPGFSENQSSTIAATITSLSFSSDSAEDAIAEINANP